jgi:Holliday junction DNA helicase RuvA
MISFLIGIIAEKKPPILVIEVNGIGYEITASMNTFYDLGEVGQEAFIYTHLIVREDAHTLFGFRDQQERQLFRTLIKVSGVGPKMAITILSSIAPNVFVQSIRNNDTATLVRLPGVGKKTAERLVIEMRDRLKDWHTTSAGDIEPQPDTHQDAIDALVSLGYKFTEAQKAIKAVATQDNNSEELIRLALQKMV